MQCVLFLCLIPECKVCEPKKQIQLFFSKHMPKNVLLKMIFQDDFPGKSKVHFLYNSTEFKFSRKYHLEIV